MTRHRRRTVPALSKREQALLDRVDWDQIKADVDQHLTWCPVRPPKPEEEFRGWSAFLASRGWLPAVGAPFTDEEKALLVGMTAPNPRGFTHEEYWS
jgi:hypothetical protein